MTSALLDVDRIIDELTRREFLGGATGTAALLGAAACNSSSTSSAPRPSSRTVDTAHGKVTVPADPARIVCVDTYTVSALLDVGRTPVGVGGGAADLILPKYRRAYNAIDKVASASQQVDVEAIAALHPDLILGVDYPYIANLRAKLAKLAPVAIFTWRTSGDWASMAASASTAVGRSSQEAGLERRYRDRANGIKTRYADVLSRVRVDLVTAGGGQAYLWLPASGVATVLADAGVRFGDASAGKTASAADRAIGFRAISFERMDALADASVIITVAGPDGKPSADNAAMLRQPTFRTLHPASVSAITNFFPFSYGQALATLDELQTILAKL